MPNATLIEVRCECKIPFHSELVHYIQKMISESIDDNAVIEIDHKEAIIQAMRNKLIFVRFDFAHSFKKIRPRMLIVFKKMFKKELIGTIKQGKDEITLILL